MQKREVAAGGLIIMLSASGACYNQLRRMEIILIQFEFCDKTNVHLIEFFSDSAGKVCLSFLDLLFVTSF